MSESSDYKRGWYDGYKAAKQTPQNPLFPQPMPSWPQPVGEPQIKCIKCGMIWKGVMGYSCPNSDCPVQPKVTY